jgi:hypothetical protein
MIQLVTPENIEYQVEGSSTTQSVIADPGMGLFANIGAKLKDRPFFFLPEMVMKATAAKMMITAASDCAPSCSQPKIRPR